MSERLIFVSGGHRFISGHSGLALRTRLAFDLLTEAWRGKERHLIAAPCEELRKRATQSGWIVHFVNPYSEVSSPVWRVFHRWITFISAHCSNSAGLKAMTMLGGSDMPPEPIAEIIHSFPSATVWLSRCDLLPVVGWLNSSNFRVVVDTNDTLLNLVRCYRPRKSLCLFTGWRKQRLERRIRELELDAAKRCGSIIAISRDDYEYYAAGAGQRIQLEESCVIASPSEDSLAIAPQYDVGFIGGAHLGSINAAKNFLRIASHVELKSHRFAVAGGVCDQLHDCASLPNVSYLGKVADASRFLSRCRQIVLWSSGETGTSVKFQEAILSGVTVLANESAARWSVAVAGRDFVLCQDEEVLVASIKERIQLPPSPLRKCDRDTLIKRFAQLSFE